MSDLSPLPKSIKAIAYTGRRKVERIDFTPDASALKPDEVVGKTIATLVSPGTEINGSFDVDRSEPLIGGYAAVFEVTAVGGSVTDIQTGQLALCLGPHTSWQRRARSEVVAVPTGLSASHAVFARMIAVSWATLTTTRARPPDRVLVTGLGIIGNLAAQIFSAAGYHVIGCDPLPARRELARRAGLSPVQLKPGENLDAQLAVECSGHEQAALDCCHAVAKGGEVVLVGVPWKKRTELPAFEILHAVFHRYVSLRSGWEWQLPFQATDFKSGSTIRNLAGALDWLATGRVRVESLYRAAVPEEAQEVYDALYRQEGNYLSAVFDWRTNPSSLPGARL